MSLCECKKVINGILNEIEFSNVLKINAETQNLNYDAGLKSK